MKQKESVIPLFFAIDDAYAPYLSVALHSAVQHASKERRYRAHVLYQSLDAENQKRLKALETEYFSICFVPMQQELEFITDTMENRLRCDYFTLTIYFRLFIAEMFPQYDRGIYLDSDIVVLDDLATLFDTPLDDCYIGACSDRSVVEIEPIARYMEQAVGVERTRYINSGVLLMDLATLREKQLGSHFLSLFNTYHFDSIAPDQDYINAICAGKIRYLDPSWNSMPNSNRPLGDSLRLIHYNLFKKPWLYDDTPYGEWFWRYVEGSGYETELKDRQNAYSPEQKKADEACLSLLIHRGEEIPDASVTFKKMTESGVKIRL